MSNLTLKKRVEILESQVADLQFAVKALLEPKKDWRLAVAKYAGDTDPLPLLPTPENCAKRTAKRLAVVRGGGPMHDAVGFGPYIGPI